MCSFFLYVAGQNFHGTDGGGRARIGVASGPSVDTLALHPHFLVEGTPHSSDERSVFPNVGAKHSHQCYLLSLSLSLSLSLHSL